MNSSVRRVAVVFSMLSSLAFSASTSLVAQTAKRAVRVGDMYRLRNVGAPEISPDGQWVAYTVTSLDSAKDKSNTDVWMASWDGTQVIQLTSSPDAETSPRWSPDGKYLSFLSSREGGKGSQLWLLDRRGGEAQRVSELKDGIDEYAWAPDSKRIALIMRASLDTADSAASKPKPIVIDRYHFKDDDNGYLDSTRAHLYLFDVADKKATLITPGMFEESRPAWSPDGKSLAFVSTRPQGVDPDRTNNSDVFVVEARAGATPKRLTTFEGPDDGPLSWSPDGRSLAYLQGSEPKFYAYSEERLAVVSVDGGAPRILTGALDRPISSAHFSADGKSIVFLYADDRAQYVGRVATSGGATQPLLTGRRVASGLSLGTDGRIAVLAGTETQPGEIFALENGSLRQLSHHNDAWLAEVNLATTEDISFKTKDGNEAHGLLVKPAGYAPGTKYPLLLRIHGGPAGQDQHSFSFERELLAANGYLVLNVNYRGSNGRGEAYQRAIYADWGNKEVVDLLAGVDYVVALGNRRSRSPRHRRLELRRHSHRLHHRDDDALQGGDLRRGERAADVDVRRRRVRLPVRQRARAAVEVAGPVDQAVLSVLPRRPHHDADAVHGRRQGLQRARGGRRTDVPGAALAQRADAAHHLSRPAPRPHSAELQLRSAVTIRGMV